MGSGNSKRRKEEVTRLTQEIDTLRMIITTGKRRAEGAVTRYTGCNVDVIMPAGVVL